MELFNQNGCLTEEGLHAVIGGQLDELGRLEAAEHLSYCDKCMDRYTALLTADVKSCAPPAGAVMHHLGAADAEHLGPGCCGRCGGSAGSDPWRAAAPDPDPGRHRRNGALHQPDPADHGAGTAGPAGAGRPADPTPSRNSWQAGCRIKSLRPPCPRS